MNRIRQSQLHVFIKLSKVGPRDIMSVGGNVCFPLSCRELAAVSVVVITQVRKVK